MYKPEFNSCHKFVDKFVVLLSLHSINIKVYKNVCIFIYEQNYKIIYMKNIIFYENYAYFTNNLYLHIFAKYPF